jgi:hypothetical protein
MLVALRLSDIQINLSQNILVFVEPLILMSHLFSAILRYINHYIIVIDG